MLVVEPPNPNAPDWVSFSVSITSTELEPESNESRVDRSGDTVINPGEFPAPMPPLALVSFSPSIISSPGGAVGLETLCEARTRVVSLLGGNAIFGPLEPQEARVKQAATTRTAGKNATLFKQQAPRDMKNLDLGAKKRIIAD